MTRKTYIDGARAARDPEGGVALILALLFIVLLTALVVEYSYENRVEASFVENAVSDFDAELAAKSAIATGLSLLAADLSLEQMGLQGDPETFREPTVDAQGGLQQLDSLEDAWAMGVPYRPLNEAAMQCLIVDEYGKLNINALVQPEEYAIATGGTGGENPAGGDNNGQNPPVQQPPIGPPDETLKEVFRVLFELRGAEEDPTDAIMDWIDPDDETRPNGAESDYYNGLEIPYACKNAPMDSVEELLLVKGITPEVFLGDPEKLQLPMTELLTVYGHPKGRLNVNTAPYEVLQALGEVLGGQSNLADRVYEEREVAPFMNDDDLRSRGVFIQPEQPQGGQGGRRRNENRQKTLLEKPFIYASNAFRIRGSGEAGEAAVMMEVYVWRTDSTSFARSLQEWEGSINSSGFGRDRSRGRTVGQSRGNLGGTDFGGPDVGPQVFRVLDWRVMR
jgi:general secretion pathway protein K